MGQESGAGYSRVFFSSWRIIDHPPRRNSAGIKRPPRRDSGVWREEPPAIPEPKTTSAVFCPSLIWGLDRCRRQQKTTVGDSRRQTATERSTRCRRQCSVRERPVLQDWLDSKQADVAKQDDQGFARRPCGVLVQVWIDGVMDPNQRPA